jgi:UDP-galactopyranose mutase
LATYQYLNMDTTIENAMEMVENILQK